MLFCATLSVSLLRTWPALVRFYAWFAASGLEISKHRGWGQTASRFYGIFAAPKLSVPAMAASGLALVLCLILPNLPAVPIFMRGPFFVLALVLYHLYFSQLYCEAHVGAHVTVLVPPALVLLALSSESGDDSELDARSRAFTAWLAKLLLVSNYCSAGVSKIRSSFKAKRAWWDGATLQASIFEALLLCRPGTHFSFGVPTPFAHSAQVFTYLRPRLLLAPMSFLAVALEALAPLVLLLQPSIGSPLFAIVGISFHYGIAYLQNVDFVSWWGPFYAFFLVDPAAVPGVAAELFGPLGAAQAAFALSPWRAALAVAYIVAHLTAMVTLHFFPEVEMLPFSCFPMFKNLQDLFNPAARKWLWLSHKPHATGTLKNYCFPFCRPQRVEVEELDLLPFKYLLFGHGGADEEVLYANFEVGTELRNLLWEIKAGGAGAFATDPEAAGRMLSLLKSAQAVFDEAPRVSAYKPPALPAAQKEKSVVGGNDDETMDTDSTQSSNGTSAGSGAGGKFMIFDKIVREHVGAAAGSSQEVLKILCTSTLIVEALVRRHPVGKVIVTLVTEDPEAMRKASRWLTQSHRMILGPPATTMNHFVSQGEVFDAAFVGKDVLGHLPSTILADGARIVLVDPDGLTGKTAL